jgi:hypothetical protein
MCVCARATATSTTTTAAVVRGALRLSLPLSYSVWKKNQVVGCIIIIIIIGNLFIIVLRDR